MNTPPVRSSGRIIEWDVKKSFGFLHDGTHRIFIHHRDFAEHRKIPERGDTVTFTVGLDFTGRTCAKEAVITSAVGKLGARDFIVLALLLIAPAFAIHRLAELFPPLVLVIASVVLSVVTYAIYAWDKHQALNNAWRVSESTLHLLAFVGGWPGAFLAQRHLRHKTAKLSFLLIFWLTVAAHQYLAADFALNWRIASQLKSLL